MLIAYFNIISENGFQTCFLVLTAIMKSQNVNTFKLLLHTANAHTDSSKRQIFIFIHSIIFQIAIYYRIIICNHNITFRALIDEAFLHNISDRIGIPLSANNSSSRELLYLTD